MIGRKIVKQNEGFELFKHYMDFFQHAGKNSFLEKKIIMFKNRYECNAYICITYRIDAALLQCSYYILVLNRKVPKQERGV